MKRAIVTLIVLFAAAIGVRDSAFAQTTPRTNWSCLDIYNYRMPYISSWGVCQGLSYDNPEDEYYSCLSYLETAQGCVVPVTACQGLEQSETCTNSGFAIDPWVERCTRTGYTGDDAALHNGPLPNCYRQVYQAIRANNWSISSCDTAHITMFNLVSCACGKYTGAEKTSCENWIQARIDGAPESCRDANNVAEKNCSCRLPTGELSNPCLLGLYARAQNKPWVAVPLPPDRVPQSCLQKERNSWNAHSAREAAEKRYKKAVGRFEAMSRTREQKIMNMIRKISAQEMIMATTLAEIGHDVGASFANALLCRDYPTFCSSNPGRFSQLAKRYITAGTRRNAAIKQTANVERTQMSRLTRYFKTQVKAKWTAMKNSYQSELDSYVAFQACMGATAPAPLLDIPELACFPQPMVSDDGCFTVPLVDITLVCSGEFWCVGVGGTNTCTGPADIQLCLPGTGGVPIS